MPTFHRGRLLALGCAIALILLASPRPVRAETGLREACRQDLSSRYLLVVTDVQQLDNEIKMLEKQIATANVAIEKAEKTFRKAKEEADREHYNPAKTEAEESASEAFRSLTQSRNETSQILATQRVKRDKQQQAQRELKDQLAKVFLIQNIQLKGGAGTSVRLEYKSTCPKYRNTCPLPQQEAWDLENIVPDTPVACQKYSKVRGPRPSQGP